ncbi:hypothetical protein TL16_g04080 [Triparma laevis f. inornata]|uniref:Peptidase C1A papain C-terminal domain-containing protein n=1 Tax=Triparma laevis f. inornata TaxID=1714386 RepID=A0A9W7E404_9STRA|nr:hypothetical protein TL16_g04080 [Triparma laevis f. inornata]
MGARSNVLRELTVHHCESLSPSSTIGESCEARRSRRLQHGVPSVEEMADSVAAFEKSIDLEHPTWSNEKVHSGEEDHWAVVVNLGGSLLEDAAHEYHDVVSMTVHHDEGTTTKTVDISKVNNGVEGIALGNFNFAKNSPRVTLQRGGENGDKPIPFSHVSYRKLEGLNHRQLTSATTGGCREDVGNQGSCGDCYAWGAVGIANEREGRCAKNGNSVRHLACKAPDIFGRNGGCEGGWMSQSLNYMRSDGLCTKKDIPWVWYCWYDDCLVCDGNWFTTDAKNPSCNKDKLDGTGSWRSMYITNPTAATTNALKSYLTNEGTFGYSFAVRNDFMKYGSNRDCYNGDPYRGGSSSCCRTKINCGKGKKCSASDCGGDDGGHAVRIVGYGTKNGDEYWDMQNSWGTGWADGGHAKISINNADWAWNHVTVDSKLWRRMLSAEPDYGADYLADEDKFHPRLLDDDELPENEQPGLNIDWPSASVITDLGETAKMRFNCSIVPPSDTDLWTEDLREPATDCLEKVALSLIDEVVVSKKLMDWIMQFSACFSGKSAPNHDTYLELADEMSTDVFDHIGEDSMETAQITFLSQYLSNLGMTADSIKSSTVQTVNGYIWKLYVNVYFPHLGKGEEDFVVALNGWANGEFTDASFNLQLEDETGFIDSEDNEEGSVTGLHKARAIVDQDFEDKMQGSKEEKTDMMTMGVVALAVGLVGVAVGFFVKHKLAESRVKQLQHQLTVFERNSQGDIKGGSDNRML